MLRHVFHGLLAVGIVALALPHTTHDVSGPTAAFRAAFACDFSAHLAAEHDDIASAAAANPLSVMHFAHIRFDKAALYRAPKNR